MVQHGTARTGSLRQVALECLLPWPLWGTDRLEVCLEGKGEREREKLDALLCVS